MIEFFGLPGAGKSTVALELVRGLAQCDSSASLATASLAPEVTRPVRLTRKAGLVALNVMDDVAAARTLWQTASECRRGRRDGLHRMIQWHVTERLLAEAVRTQGTTVLEEGFLQCLWSACLADETERWLQLYGLKRRPVPDVLVVLRVTPVVAATRLAKRPSRHSRVQRIPGDALMRELLLGDALVEDLLRWWRRTGDVPRAVVEVNADGSAHDVAATVLQCLLHRSASSAERGR
ncbi:MAG TPA: hypothetical protein VFX33_07675 [Actinomycetales bacterium]|nr:hypothetical protein [Actinomycetales bacterium]